MAFCITFGKEDFRGQLEGYENVVARCYNCGNYAARVETRWPFITVCFIPMVPLSCHKYHEIRCPICNHSQDLSTRPDVQPGAGVVGGPPPPGVPTGWNAGYQPQAPGPVYGYK